jgi:hypothetical protein
MKFTLETPEVAALLTGVFRRGIRTYYRTDEAGKPYVYPLRRELAALGMCAKTATGLMQGVPFAPYVSNKPPAPEKPAKKSGPTEEEREAKVAAKEGVAQSKRFQFITTNSGKFGVWDGVSGRILSLFSRQEDAIAELTRIKTGKSYIEND